MMSGSATTKPAAPNTDFDRTVPGEPTTAARWRIFGLLYIAYGMSMVLRTLPTIASTSIKNDPALGVDLTAWGQIIATGTMGGFTGKFLWGWLADVLGGRITLMLGLLLAAAGAVGFSAAADGTQIRVAVFVIMLAQAAGWPAMTKLVAAWALPQQAGRVWGFLSTSSRVGVLLATFGLGGLVSEHGWRYPGLLAAAAAVPLAFLYVLFVRNRPLIERQSAERPVPAEPLADALLRFAGSARCWLICGALMGMAVLWDVLLLIPLFLDSLGIPASAANEAASAFPLGSLMSVLAGGCVFDWLGRRRMALVMPLLLLTAAVCVGILAALPAFALTPTGATQAALVLLFVFGACLAPCYYIPASIFSTEFGGARAGLLVSLLDAAGFAATAAFYWKATSLAQSYGWSILLVLLSGIGLAASCLLAVFLRGEAVRRDQVAV